MVKCVVRSHAILGGGPFAYAVYKVEIELGKETWVVYRRFSEFVKLYDHARHEVGNNFRNLGVLPLDPGNGGSIYGTFQETIYKRVPMVNTLIQKLVGLDPNRLLNCVATFIDMTNKGASGVSVVKGKSNILIESFLQCKHHYLSVWSTHLIVVTKDGYLYELGTMFDAPNNAINTVNLTKPDVHIKGRTSKLIADITYDYKTHNYPGSESTYEDCKKLHILFNSSNDLANFLRNTSEFTSKPTQTLDRGYKAPTKDAPQNNQPVTDVRAQGTGNTKDVLSSTYGL